MTKSLVSAVLVGLVTIPLCGQDAAMPAALRDHVRAERFIAVAKVVDLPQPVRASLASLFGESTLQMAEPGAPFQSTDAVIGPRLPFRRLIAAGCSSDHCLVYYEKGGFAHVANIALFSTAAEKVRVEWGGQAARSLAGLDGAKDALLSGKVVSQTKYW